MKKRLNKDNSCVFVCVCVKGKQRNKKLTIWKIWEIMLHELHQFYQ